MKIHLLKYLYGDFDFIKRTTDQLILESRIAPVTIEIEEKFFLHSGIQNISFEYSQQYLDNFRSNCISFFSKIYESQELVESVVFKDCNLHPKIVEVIKTDILGVYPEIEFEVHQSTNYNIGDIREQIKKHNYTDKKDYRYALKKLDYLYSNFFRFYNPNTYVTEFVKEENQRTAIIVDIDGTISVLNENRSLYDVSNSDDDTVVKPMKKLIELYSNDGTEVIFVTGRYNKFREVTYNWLRKNVLPEKDFHLFMKKDGDLRNDFDVKKEIYLEKIDKEFNTLAVFEDRSNVVEMWRSLGLFCLQPMSCNY